MTFDVVVTTFLAGRGMSLADVPLTSGQDDQVSPEITYESLSDAFRKNHTALASLDPVQNTVNLAQANSGVESDWKQSRQADGLA